METAFLRICLLSVAGLLLTCAGCMGPHYKEHPLVILTTKQPPELQGPHDPAIEQNLSTNPWSRSVLGPYVGAGNVFWKSLGFSGWKDYHMHAEARGVEVQHQFEDSDFLTVDLRLKSLMVNGVSIPITNTKYMRLEIFLARVKVDDVIHHQTNEVITADGKLVWDSDGWFEIHPQKTGDVEPGDKPHLETMH